MNINNYDELYKEVKNTSFEIEKILMTIDFDTNTNVDPNSSVIKQLNEIYHSLQIVIDHIEWILDYQEKLRKYDDDNDNPSDYGNYPSYRG